MPTLSRIAVHPIKSLDPADRDRVGITDVGGLAGDRVYAVVDGSGNYVNGKRTAKVHRIRADADLDGNRVTLRWEGDGTGASSTGGPREFRLDSDRTELEAWLSEHLGIDVELVAGQGGALTDRAVYGDGSKTGPTVIAEATLREAASWYDGIGPREMAFRLRPNLVVEGVPPFWEERLFAGGGRRLRVGDVTMEGVEVVPRCVVPTRDPHTGEEYEGFRETFVRKREETLAEWTDPADLDGNFFSLMAAARIPEDQRDGTLEVGDEVGIADAEAPAGE
ncbi:hypothetical protein BRD00_01540 [Halobacteriales archaeon QS_8_69_26]|nr:MAG: hypothetical protein BRD00_01540 [Halobacteriales archaeon QS_8_69_26]